MTDIVHVLAPGVIGGTERVVEMLATSQIRTGNNVTVVSILTEGGDKQAFAASLEANEIRVERIIAHHRSYMKESSAIGNAIFRLQPSVIHSHGYHTDVLLALISRRHSATLVSTAHGFTGGGWKNRFYEWLQLRAYRRFHGVVAVSYSIAARLHRAGVDPDLVDVIPNAFYRDREFASRKEARMTLGWTNQEIVIGWVGRLSPEKGPNLLLDVLVELKDLPVVASVIGVGSELNTLRKRAELLGLGSRLRWHGQMKDAAQVFPAFDVFLLTSRCEGTPIVLLEAMASQVPIVATAVGGVPDLLTDGEHALLVPWKDPAASAAAVRLGLDNVDETALRATAAKRRLCEEYGWDRWVRRYDQVYLRAKCVRHAPSSGSR